MRQISALLMLSLFLVSCGNKSKSTKYGEMLVSDLVASKGEPEKKETLSGAEREMYVYEDNEKFQIEKGIVVNSFRTPHGDEKMLIHWKHKYPDCRFEIKKLDQKVIHQKVEEEYKCLSAGISVIYDPNIEQVVRVVEYAAE